jgi:hypothetical protein
MAIQIPWEQDLHSADPVQQLSMHVEEALAHGYDRNRIVRELEELFVLVQDEGTEADQDAVTDVLDLLTRQSSLGLAI